MERTMNHSSAAAARAWRRAADQRDRPPLPAGAGRNGVSRLNVCDCWESGGIWPQRASGRPQPRPVKLWPPGKPCGLLPPCQRGWP